MISPSGDRIVWAFQREFRRGSRSRHFGPEAVTVPVFAAALPPWGAAFDGRMALSMPLAAESGIFPGKFWRNEFFRLYLQSRNESSGIFAEIAQLVERNLAKVEVAGPSPVFRSENL